MSSSNNNLFDGLIRHDRLLTDSLVGLLPNSLQDMPVVKTEHSYSMAGSDGDSIPDSPLSVNNDTGELLLVSFFDPSQQKMITSIQSQQYSICSMIGLLST